MWIRGRQVGGKTFCGARISYSYSDNEFQAASRDGYGENWPITYKDLEPYYDRVEGFIGVSGSREGANQSASEEVNSLRAGWPILRRQKNHAACKNGGPLRARRGLTSSLNLNTSEPSDRLCRSRPGYHL